MYALPPISRFVCRSVRFLERATVISSEAGGLLSPTRARAYRPPRAAFQMCVKSVSLGHGNVRTHD